MTQALGKLYHLFVHSELLVILTVEDWQPQYFEDERTKEYRNGK